jgi:hypothetical protein
MRALQSLFYATLIVATPSPSWTQTRQPQADRTDTVLRAACCVGVLKEKVRLGPKTSPWLRVVRPSGRTSSLAARQSAPQFWQAISWLILLRNLTRHLRKKGNATPNI